MHSFAPEIALLTLIGIVLLAKLFNDKLKFPIAYSLLLLSYGVYQINPSLLGVAFGENFVDYLLFCIPIILMKDAYHFKLKELKKHAWSIFYLAVIAVSISIFVGTTMFYFDLFPGLTIGMYVALFAINMATDAISVENIMSQFKGVDKDLKVLVEGESLGNDATAMIAFYFIGLPWLISGQFDLSTIPLIATKVFGLSLLIGLVIGFIGYFVLKVFKEARYETLILIAIAYSSFLAAEKLHLAGIFSLIVAIVTVKALIDKDLAKERKENEVNPSNKKGLFAVLKKESTNKENQKTTVATLSEYAYLAVVIVFFSLSDIINFENILKYLDEILIMFAITTVIRSLSMGKFFFLSHKVRAFNPITVGSWFVLTMAGIKGALSIIMVHSLPKDFMWLERFEAITIGVIILSIFVYGTALLIYFLIKEKREAKNLS